MKKIIKLLEYINLNFEKTREDILFNPNKQEVLKKFRGLRELRFVIDENDNYWVADARRYTHGDIRNMSSIKTQTIEGFIYLKERVCGVDLGKAMLLFDFRKEWKLASKNPEKYHELMYVIIPNRFKETSFYKNLEGLFDNIRGI